MRQVLQDLKNGELLLEDVPAPRARAGSLLIRTSRTLISAGTERMLANFAKANYLQKARQQPEKFKQVLDKARTDGVLATYEAVTDRLAQPLPMGYCNVGRVMAVGDGVQGFEVGDRVASNGPHAEVVSVPKNLCAKVPDGVSDDAAAFTVISSIALQGLRLIEPTLGETVVVSGLGLIGLIAVQLFKANGCHVIGFDYSAERVALARRFGAEAHSLSQGADPIALAMAATGGQGVDAVLIAASAKSDELISQCARMCRKRGRIVLTGVVGLDLKREDFYDKELSLRVSCSYGPGRYDPDYEDRGRDYPIGFVRWTQQRNFEAVLGLMAEDRLATGDLVSDRYAFSDAKAAYGALDQGAAIGILLDYGEDTPDETLRRNVVSISPSHHAGGGAIGVIGAGPFTQAKLLPGLQKAGIRIKGVASSTGVSGSIAARRFEAEQSISDHRLLLGDGDISTVVIATPHNTHAPLTIEAIRAGKNVFVEKPLCLTGDELDEIVAAREEAKGERGAAPFVMVGFNRRFAPLAIKMKEALRGRVGPAFASYTCNAGFIPADNPYQDPAVGGRRIIGEACHFIDFVAWLLDQPIVAVSAMKQDPQGMDDLEDNVAIMLKMKDGSVGQVNYIACGAKSYPKERAVAMWDGKVAELDNFLRMRTYGTSTGNARAMRQDKGHDAELAALAIFMKSGGEAPIPFGQVVNTTRATLAVVEAMRSGASVSVRNETGESE